MRRLRTAAHHQRLKQQLPRPLVAGYLRSQQRRVTSALIYPSVIFSAGIALLVIFMTFLLPQLTALLGKTGQS